MCSCCGHSSNKFWFYIASIALGIVCGLSGVSALEEVGKFCSEAFVRIFRCVSMPVISLSVIVALSGYGADKAMNRIWKKTLKYTLATTIAAAMVSAILYFVISPSNVGMQFAETSVEKISSTGYAKYLLEVIPDGILGSFIEHKVLSVLLISLIIGISIRNIKNTNARETVKNFFDGLHNIFFAVIKFVVRILPIGLFGFITVGVIELHGKLSLNGMGEYFLIIVLANLLQGVLVLPLFLASKKINPFRVAKAMLPALSVAFFSKTSSGTLPVTITAAENLGIKKDVCRFVLPLCTTINMNGCAAFIFTTVVYVMQNYGVAITPLTMLTWVLIATIAAVGNAGVPMGCFFLSASLLSSMDIPMPLLGMILPIYSLIDMLETSLNVWSDSCVATVVDREMESGI